MVAEAVALARDFDHDAGGFFGVEEDAAAFDDAFDAGFPDCCCFLGGC